MNLLCKVLLWSFFCRVMATPLQAQQTGSAGATMKPRTVPYPFGAVRRFTLGSVT